jgi:hypothetical protein
MADNHYDLVLVWDRLGSSVRLRPYATATVVDPFTGAAVTVTQNGQPTTVVKADANGRCSFVAQQGRVSLVDNGLVQIATSAEYGMGVSTIDDHLGGNATGLLDPSGKVAASKLPDLSAIFAPADSYAAKAQGKCKGDGTTDDTAALSAAMDAANAAGKPLFLEPGTYKCAGITKAYGLTVWALPGTVTILATNTSGYVWTFAGSLGAQSALTANATRGAGTVSANGTGLAAGDVILLGDSTVPFSGNPTRTQGQLVEVASATSTAITLREGVYAPLTASPFYAKVTTITAKVLGVNFLATNPTTLGGFVNVENARDVDIDTEGRGSGSAGVRLFNVYGFRVKHRARNYYDTAVTGLAQYGYGVLVAGASAHGSADVNAAQTRHAFATSGVDNAAGEVLNVRVTGVAHGCTSTAWDTHAQSADVSFIGCQAYGGGGYGFALRSKRGKIQGGKVDGARGGVYLFENPSDIVIDGLDIDSVYGDGTTDGIGIRVDNGIAGLSIRGGTMVNVPGNGVHFNCPVADVTVSGTLFRNLGTAGAAGIGYGVRFLGTATRALVRGVTVRDSSTTPTTLAAVDGAVAGADVTVDGVAALDGVPLLGTHQTSGYKLGANYAGGAPSILTGTDLARTFMRPAGALRETVPRGTTSLNSSGALTSGTLFLTAIALVAGDQVRSISVVAAGTGAASPTAQWFGLFDANRNALALTADDGATAWPANTTKTLSFAATYMVPTSGLYYVGVMVAAATVPSLYVLNNGGSLPESLPPVLSGTSTAGMSAPPSLPFTAAAIAPQAQRPYIYLS